MVASRASAGRGEVAVAFQQPHDAISVGFPDLHGSKHLGIGELLPEEHVAHHRGEVIVPD